MKTYRVPHIRVTTPEIAAGAELLGRFAKKRREHLAVLHLDADLWAVCVQQIASGSMMDVKFEVGDIFRKAILRDSKILIVGHNHPYERKIRVSKFDREFTERLWKAGNLLGIPVFDHLVLGKNDFYSFRKNGVIVPKSKVYTLSDELLARKKSKVGPTHFELRGRKGGRSER